MAALSDAEVCRARMRSQLLDAGTAESVAGVAAWFGALQAQDLQSGLWSFGVRLPVDRAAVESAVAAGEVLRTWPMRGTLHFVAASDARWLLRTTGVRALRTTSARWRGLGLDQSVADRAVEAFARALGATPRLTRGAMLDVLRGEGIDPAGQRGYHLLWYASQIGLTCLGPNEGSQQTFVRLDDWAPDQAGPVGQEALAELARRYFRSHGPTTVRDFIGWSGLTAAQARAGVAAAGDALQSLRDERGAVLLASASALESIAQEPVVRLLPGFDEYVLGYKERDRFLPEGRIDDIVPGRNGVFRPTVVIDGRVAGTWRRSTGAQGVRVDVSFFDPVDAPVRRAVQLQAQRYADYLGLPLL